MHVYDTLRDELVADPLTEGQPQFAADHLKRVGQDALDGLWHFAPQILRLS